MKKIIELLMVLVIEKTLEKVLDIYLTKETIQHGLTWLKHTKKTCHMTCQRVVRYICRFLWLKVKKSLMVVTWTIVITTLLTLFFHTPDSHIESVTIDIHVDINITL